MYAADLYPVIGRQDHGIAATLEQILFHWDRHRGAHPIRLTFITRFVKRSVSALSRYVQWLEREGFIQIRRVRKGSAQLLYIRPLIRLKKPSHGTVDESRWDGEENRMGRYTQGDTQENTQGNLAPTPERGRASVAAMVLKKPLSGVKDRIAQKAQEVRARALEKPPAPKSIAYEWNRLLREYGYEPLNPNDAKVLAHIKKTLLLLGEATTEGFLAELERRFLMWPDHRPKSLGKAPPHPWAINRTDLLFQKGDTVMTPFIPITVDKPENVSSEPAPMVKMAKSSGGMLGKGKTPK